MRRLFLCGIAWACGGDVKTLPPEGQIVLYVDTDAIVVGTETPPLFDTLTIDVFPPDAVVACEGCSRDFEADNARFAKSEMSIGIPVKPHTPGYGARVRLFRRANSPTGLSLPNSTIEIVVALPEVSEEGIVPVSVFLPTEMVGIPRGTVSNPVAATTGLPPASQIGTWPGGKRVSCTVSPNDDEVCVQGGAFWMGNLRVIDWIANVSSEPRLVVLAPYLLKSTEVTVGEYRKYSPVGGGVTKRGAQPVSISAYCSFTSSAGVDEGRSLNCIAPTNAQAFCKARGGDLPTEAQLEFAAGRFRSTLYPWGDDEPTCADAVWGRLPPIFKEPSKSVCLPADLLPAPPKTGKLDQVPSNERVIFDLGGNVEEWARDSWQPFSGVCWGFAAKDNILYDPYCPYDGTGHVAKGGSWERGANGMAAAVRDSYSDISVSIRVGFRCARPAE